MFILSTPVKKMDLTRFTINTGFAMIYDFYQFRKMMRDSEKYEARGGGEANDVKRRRRHSDSD